MINVVVVGAGGSGKSALCIRYCNGTFVERYDPTIEDTYRRQVEVDGRSVMVMVTDTAGQEQYEETMQMSLALASCIVVAVASDSEASFHLARRFIELARDARVSPSLRLSSSTAGGASAARPPVMVVRTKSDTLRRVVSDDDLAELCQTYEIKTPVMATSAKNNHGVAEAFDEAIRLSAAYNERAYALESSRKRSNSASVNANGHGRGRRNSITASLLASASALRSSSSDTTAAAAANGSTASSSSSPSVSAPTLRHVVDMSNGHGGSASSSSLQNDTMIPASMRHDQRGGCVLL